MVWHQRNRWNSSRQVRWALSFARGVISISDYVAKDSHPITAPHKVIYNPVAKEEINLQACRAKLREELGLEKDVSIVGCFGNAAGWKRPDTLIDVSRFLACNAPLKVKVVWVGDDRNGLLDRMLHKAGPNCTLSRLPFRADVMSTMAGCDVVVTASESEPFGRTPVEAMALGVPVVVSAAGGHLEIVEHEENGLLFPVGDAEACARAIMRLLLDAKLKQTLIANGKFTAERFSPRQHALKVLAFYKLIGKQQI